MGALRNSFAIPKEFGRVSTAWMRHGVMGLPILLGRSVLQDPSLDGIMSAQRFFELFGQSSVDLFNALGPIYGKAGQMALSRLSPKAHDYAEQLRLTRLYKDWPPLQFSEIEKTLDEEIPDWRKELKIEKTPLGVASLAQVHAATDSQQKEWVIKIIKPYARKRLLESVAALEQMIALFEPVAITQTSRRGLKELKNLTVGFRQELSLGRERETILRVHEKMKNKKQKALVIPEVHPHLHSDRVLIVERFRGVSLADIVSSKIILEERVKQKLAKSMLSELLVQVFELGLFHADPHAGNLILMDDGSVGLFDWGLSGELLESDRTHIAAILKAILALDKERLVDALMHMALEGGREIDRHALTGELKAVAKMIAKGREDPTKKPSMQELLEACLNAAHRLEIPIPEGLMMMAKSLLTIEGLARGLDPKVSLGRVATPVLLKAAQPTWSDVWAITRKLPTVAKQFFKS
jgi:ubiquinone biosynthesis protein